MRRRFTLPFSLVAIPFAAAGCGGSAPVDASTTDTSSIDTVDTNVVDAGPTLCVPAYDPEAGVTCRSINPNPELFCIRLTCDAGAFPDADNSQCCQLVG